MLEQECSEKIAEFNQVKIPLLFCQSACPELDSGRGAGGGVVKPQS